MKKSGVLDPDYIGKSLISIIDSFIESTSDDLLLVYVKILLKFEVSFVQKRPWKQAFKRKKFSILSNSVFLSKWKCTFIFINFGTSSSKILTHWENIVAVWIEVLFLYLSKKLQKILFFFL